MTDWTERNHNGLILLITLVELTFVGIIALFQVLEYVRGR